MKRWRVFLVVLAGLLVWNGAPSLLGQGDYNFRISDPLRGSSLADINTAYWGNPWVVPGRNGAFSISSNGLVLSGFDAYLGLKSPGPLANWVIGGDFRIKVYLDGLTYGRYQFGIYEVYNAGGGRCSGLNPSGYAGIASTANMGNAVIDTYVISDDDEGAFFLFVMQGGTVSIYAGDATGVSETSNSPVFSKFFGPSGTGEYLVYLGTGGNNYGSMLVRDVEIESEVIHSCVTGSVMPENWAIAADADGDGVDDAVDACPGTLPDSIVDSEGCSIADYSPCDGEWRNHGAYVSTVAHLAEQFLNQGLISEMEKGTIVSEAAHSACGSKR